MSGVFLDVMEINIAVSVIFLVLFLLSGKLRKWYGAGWLKMVWVLLAVRLLIPYNFSLPGAQIRLLMFPDGRQEQGMPVQGENSTGNPLLPDQILSGEGSGSGEGIYGSSGANIEEKEAAGNGMLPEKGTADEGQIHLSEPSAGKMETGKPEISRTLAEGAEWSDWLFSGDIFAWIWMAGVGICALLCVGSYLCFWFGCRRNLRPVTDIGLRKQVLRLERKYNGRANIPVYQNQAVKSPMLAGVLFPKLILPAGRTDWTDTELELVVVHELCHYKSKDLWLKFLMTAAWCMNWFNPLVWMLKKQFFYELELACDGRVLSGHGRKLREAYARTMLSFAGKKGTVSVFSTEFGESKKQMKRRIDYMLDVKEKKKGIISIVMTSMLLLAMGLMVSCGSKPEEEGSLKEQDTRQGETAAPDVQGQGAGSLSQDENAGTGPDSGGMQTVPYDPNNEYNEMVRYYGDDVFLSREDGIYRLSGDRESEELLYANDYHLKRGMEIYQDSLYFCGSARRGEQEASTVYRMDLKSYEVKDALALFSQVFDGLYTVTVYEGKLYATYPNHISIGFELDENGEAIRMLDEQSEGFLYKEDNAYWQLNLKIWNNEVVFDSEEYWDTVNQMSDMYRNVIDAAACEKMLNGDQVVLKYKDELLTGVYLKKKDGEYEFLCDTISYPALVTETGVYYFPDESFAIWYVDYETKTQRKIWEKEDRKPWEVQLVNYDQDYVYFTASNRVGRDQENVSIYESYLMRVPRWTAENAEKVYRFESYGNLGSMYRNSGIAGEKIFFNDHGTVTLDPAVNGMERENRGEPSEDAIAMRQSVENFAEAYFQNEEEALKAYLAENFEGGIDLYPYPEQAGQIEELYISGLPDGELPVGVICFVSYEFGGNAETDGALSYLSMELEKTEQGWKVLNYGLEG